MIEEKSIELFITEEESLMLEALAQSDIPHSQRAQAILAVDAGSTIEQAAQVANLKVTQVRFWLGRFRNSRLSVFPESLIEEMETLLKVKQKRETTEGKPEKKKKAKKSKVKKNAKGAVKKIGNKVDKKKKQKGKKKKETGVKDKKKKKDVKANKDRQKKKNKTKKAGKKKK